jgi:hypothetical protein
MTDEQAFDLLAEAIQEYYPTGEVVDPDEVYGVPDDEQLDYDEPWDSERYNPSDLSDLEEGEVFELWEWGS